MRAEPLAAVDSRRLTVGLATSRAEVEQAQKLRYRVFAEEMGASLHSLTAHTDYDAYDDYCEHLLVRDNHSGEVVSCTRILTGARALDAGGFYSASEFHIDNILCLPGKIMEIGRTCVDSRYRNGATLWFGLGQYIFGNQYDYVIGCASIGMQDGGAEVRAIMERLRGKHMSERDRGVEPCNPLPACDTDHPGEVRMPPLLKAYLSLGAKVCGEPCWDPDFQVADVFILFDIQNTSPRYARHFLREQAMDMGGAAIAVA